MKDLSGYKPQTVDEAADAILKSMSMEDSLFVHCNKDSAIVHHGFGAAIRNTWGLWNKESPVIKDAIAKYGIAHADDVSGIIMHIVWCRTRGEVPNPGKLAAQYIAHWKKHGCDPLTGSKAT